MSSDLAARSEAACALPLPSASASANVPNSTVSQSQTISWSWNGIDRSSPPSASSTVSSVATTAVVNSTGLRTSWRGSSFLKASPIAGRIRSAVKTEVLVVMVAPQKSWPRIIAR